MTFLQLLVSVEEMQSQQRAENGIEEIIIGYIGHDPLEPEEELTDLVKLGTAFMESGVVSESTLQNLPDDVRSVVLAESHRRATGQVLPSSFYSQKWDEMNEGGG